jgi:hypothetical protein
MMSSIIHKRQPSPRWVFITAEIVMAVFGLIWVMSPNGGWFGFLILALVVLFAARRYLTRTGEHRPPWAV